MSVQYFVEAVALINFDIVGFGYHKHPEGPVRKVQCDCPNTKYRPNGVTDCVFHFREALTAAPRVYAGIFAEITTDPDKGQLLLRDPDVSRYMAYDVQQVKQRQLVYGLFRLKQGVPVSLGEALQRNFYWGETSGKLRQRAFWYANQLRSPEVKLSKREVKYSYERGNVLLL